VQRGKGLPAQARRVGEVVVWWRLVGAADFSREIGRIIRYKIIFASGQSVGLTTKQRTGRIKH